MLGGGGLWVVVMVDSGGDSSGAGVGKEGAL